MAARTLADGRARYVRVRPKAKLAEEAPGPDVELHANACPSGGSIELFVEPVLPRPMLILAGASPVARALAVLGRGAGFAVTAAAAAEDLARFEGADHRIEGFDLSAAPGAASGFVVVATQGKRDREALAGALASGAPYVAFVGSRRKAAALKETLSKAGADPERLAALHAPAGLDIGAATPEEVALSILAQIVQLRRAGEAREGVRAAGAGGDRGRQPGGRGRLAGQGRLRDQGAGILCAAASRIRPGGPFSSRLPGFWYKLYHQQRRGLAACAGSGRRTRQGCREGET